MPPPTPTGRSRLALGAQVVGLIGLLLTLALLAWLPQRPDGDATAQAAFDARHAASPLHQLRTAWSTRATLALLVWGALDSLLGARRGHSRRGDAVRRLAWAGLLLLSIGLMWESRSGWQGTLFLEPHHPVRVGPDEAPLRLTFERFNLAPAPDGPGRTLRMALRVNQRAVQASAPEPYRGGGWTVRPHWYGATVEGETLAAPLFFGLSGSQEATLRDGRRATVTVAVEPLTIRAEPPVAGLRVHHHAIIAARYAPGAWMQRAGAALLAGGWLGAWADSRRRQRRL